MKDTYPGFVWRLEENKRLELELGITSFVVEPQGNLSLSIKGQSRVCHFYINIAIIIHV